MENNDQSVRDAKSQDASGTETKESVSYETHRKLLSQRKKDQEELAAIRDELQAFKSSQKQAAEEELAKQGQYKELLDQREKELNEIKTQFGDWKNQVIDNEKIRAFEKHLPGKIKNEEYLNFVDTKKILINPESGTVDEESLKMVVGEFMEQHGDSLVKRENIGKLPSGAAPLVDQRPKKLDVNDKNAWRAAAAGLLATNKE